MARAWLKRVVGEGVGEGLGRGWGFLQRFAKEGSFRTRTPAYMPRGPNDQKNAISLEILKNLDRNFKSRSKISMSTSRFPHKKYRRVPFCAVKTCAVRPVFARVVGELRAADPSNVQGPAKQNASPGEQSEAPRRRWKQNPGAENQDSQHMLEQPRGPFLGHTPSTAGTFRKKFRKNSGKTPETLSERFLEFPSSVRLGCPKPYN